MKSFAPIALFAAGAFAAPNAAELSLRQLSNVNTIMETVLAGIQSLDQTCVAYSGGQGQELVQASDKMLTIIRTATDNAAAMQPLSMDEAIAFQPLSDKLNAAGDKLLDDITGKLSLYAQNCICESTLNWVSQISGNVNTLMTTISTKFPQGGKGGDEISHFGQVFTQMQESLQSCSGKACTPGSGPAGGFTPTEAAVPGAAAPTGSAHRNGTSSGREGNNGKPNNGKPNNGKPNNGKPNNGKGNNDKDGNKGKESSTEDSTSMKPVSVSTGGAAMMTFSGAGVAAALAVLLL
ncbi:hypothetical protein CkaCkLH20_12285 [Colletotrichum karsti]|uniref:Cell wall protein n=1 Tax=Colletotrichum karsti TaxID=1095194 RepID=A0A9P6HTY5_9PEZI|nr:uncharacterized protein CkaCkLH20_12285 [Colletotrichum karsti]KAF9870199.1 hypothetical protein CkaCkLH20_12285 [Colletotrichum karsti]